MRRRRKERKIERIDVEPLPIEMLSRICRFLEVFVFMWDDLLYMNTAIHDAPGDDGTVRFREMTYFGRHPSWGSAILLFPCLNVCPRVLIPMGVRTLTVRSSAFPDYPLPRLKTLVISDHGRWHCEVVKGCKRLRRLDAPVAPHDDEWEGRRMFHAKDGKDRYRDHSMLVWIRDILERIPRVDLLVKFGWGAHKEVCWPLVIHKEPSGVITMRGTFAYQHIAELCKQFLREVPATEGVPKHFVLI